MSDPRSQTLMNQAALLLKFPNTDAQIRDILKMIYEVGVAEGRVEGAREMGTTLNAAVAA